MFYVFVFSTEWWNIELKCHVSFVKKCLSQNDKANKRNLKSCEQTSLTKQTAEVQHIDMPLSLPKQSLLHDSKTSSTVATRNYFQKSFSNLNLFERKLLVLKEETSNARHSGLTLAEGGQIRLWKKPSELIQTNSKATNQNTISSTKRFQSGFDKTLVDHKNCYKCNSSSSNLYLHDQSNANYSKKPSSRNLYQKILFGILKFSIFILNTVSPNTHLYVTTRPFIKLLNLYQTMRTLNNNNGINLVCLKNKYK